MHGLTDEELRVLKPLNTPVKIQDFLDTLKMNFEPRGDTCMSPRVVLRKREAHCIEGAMLACVALRLNGQKPLVMDLSAGNGDYDHVVALFRRHGMWGCASKTNHAVLRYREPVYASPRELAMSFFHEYTDDKGRKTLRTYSDPIDISKLDHRGWMTSEKDVWFVPTHLIRAKHHQILSRAQLSGLRKADPIEIRVGRVTEWNDPKRRKKHYVPLK
jgi:hypothetical protein